ncbi:MAG: serine/threonine protein kinase [Cyanobacteria bacterium HKST-UBA01]|nr:serine/threonine protein kinase [Cyanobacteria bacterium HKST-UBA01]
MGQIKKTNSITASRTKHPYIGTKIGQYEIIELLGGGAMGLVFKAHQKSVGRDVAIKFLSHDLGGDELSRRRMEREAHAMGKLKHPGLVVTYEFGISDFGQPYIVMEYVDGIPLSERLQLDNGLDEERAIHFFIQIADAMEYAHRHGVVHRDLKPANIMVTQEPWPDFLKIFDFGIARITADSQMLTCPGEVLGSPVYMSPEQCKGEDIDARSDIYTLGVIMYFSLTGTFPVMGTDGRTTMLLKTRNEPTPLSKSAPDLNLHPYLENLIMRMLRAEASDRPQSMGDVKKELESIALERTYILPKRNIQAISSAGMPATPNSSDFMLNGLLSALALAVLAIGFSSFNYPGNSATAVHALADIHKESANTAIAFQGADSSSPPIMKLEEPINSLHKTSAPEAPENPLESEPVTQAVPETANRIDQATHRAAQTETNPMVKLARLNPADRAQIKHELLDYLEKQQKQQKPEPDGNTNRPYFAKGLTPTQRRQLRLRSGMPPNRRERQNSQFPFSSAKQYGNTPYNQVHRF